MKLLTIFRVALLMSPSIIGTSWLCKAEKAPSCVRQLLPCLSFLNGTRDPPDRCCNSLKLVIKENPECLCQLISTKGARQAQKAGINIDKAQELPGRCGERVNPIACIIGNSGERSSQAAAMTTSLSNLGFPALVLVICLLGTIQYHIA